MVALLALERSSNVQILRSSGHWSTIDWNSIDCVGDFEVEPHWLILNHFGPEFVELIPREPLHSERLVVYVRYFFLHLSSLSSRIYYRRVVNCWRVVCTLLPLQVGWQSALHPNNEGTYRKERYLRKQLCSILVNVKQFSRCVIAELVYGSSNVPSLVDIGLVCALPRLDVD